jgi:cytochrome c1
MHDKDVIAAQNESGGTYALLLSFCAASYKNGISSVPGGSGNLIFEGEINSVF